MALALRRGLEIVILAPSPSCAGDGSGTRDAVRRPDLDPVLAPGGTQRPDAGSGPVALRRHGRPSASG
jgi:hypothetical protein